ncbi:hypothetical protein BG004_004393 [Podila humilis]|nr:hypothetical protein BG004_004393 [Podila humilis]
MEDLKGSDNYRAWIFTLASAMACVFGAGLIFTDTIIQKVFGRDLQILENHKFLAGSLGLGSGVMVYSSFYNLLPEAKQQLSSDLSIFRSHADAYLMLFFFSGVLLMALVHWIMHRFDSGSKSQSGIETPSGSIEQFIQREQTHHQQHRSFVSGLPTVAPYLVNGRATTGGAGAARTANNNNNSNSNSNNNTNTNTVNGQQQVCQGCINGETTDLEEDERYNDSEYVDDEVTSLLNNAFLQIGKTPNSRMDVSTDADLRERGSGDDDECDNHDEDDESIEVVIADKQDKILRRTPDQENSDLDLDMEDDMVNGQQRQRRDNFAHLNRPNHHHQRNKSWSSVSTRSQKPFAPNNKRRKASTAAAAAAANSGKGSKVNGSRTSNGQHKEENGQLLDQASERRHPDYKHRHHHHRHHHHHPGQPPKQHHPNCPRLNGNGGGVGGVNTLVNYGALNNNSNSNNNSNNVKSNHHHHLHHHHQQQHNHLHQEGNQSHQHHNLRRTSFPRLNQKGSQSLTYSSHDNLDHAVTDDREHTDLTEVGLQTALTIAVHKFPEGLITFLSTTADPCLGLSVFMAIAVHNIIEGYLIAFPLFVGMHSRTRAFTLAAALGGFSQPLGAILGWFILRKVASMGWQVSATGVIYALVAGMMASIAVNGMWPQAVKCVGRQKTKVVQLSFFAGIAIMGICQAVMGTTCDL